MSEDNKERTVDFGCAVYVIIGLIVGAIMGIHSELRQINKTLIMANCLTEAAHGITCPEAKRK